MLHAPQRGREGNGEAKARRCRTFARLRTVQQVRQVWARQADVRHLRQRVEEDEEVLEKGVRMTYEGSVVALRKMTKAW